MNPPDESHEDEPAERKSRFWQIMNAAQKEEQNQYLLKKTLYKAKTEPVQPEQTKKAASEETIPVEKPKSASLPPPSTDLGETRPVRENLEQMPTELPEWLNIPDVVPETHTPEASDNSATRDCTTQPTPTMTTHPRGCKTTSAAGGRRMVVPTPAVDRNGMPLPRRVDEIDPFATRVTPSAVPGTTRQNALPPLSAISKTTPV